ncbi:carbohydrate kinase family protein [Candidatus Bathyarchaeota archaeon]|nr:carbohydrate kinase family protein [Candidatus Bathyarchaeota archaeon]
MILDVLGFGALNLDKLYRVDKIAEAGEETFVKGLTISPGGSAANTIVGLARLGVNTGYIGKIANDSEGKYILNDLRNEEVNVKGVDSKKKGRSGVCIGFVDDFGERSLYIDPGVNDNLAYKEINQDYVESSKFVHLTSFVGNIPFRAQKSLVKKFESEITMDPGELYARKGINEIKPILKKTFVFLPNENEIRILTNQNYEIGAKELIKLGISIIAVKLGHKGCYVTNGKEDYLIPPLKKKAKDSTGAGDAFCSGFIYGLLHGRDIYECGRLGNFIASCCIEKYGARTGLPTKRKFTELYSK